MSFLVCYTGTFLDLPEKFTHVQVYHHTTQKCEFPLRGRSHFQSNPSIILGHSKTTYIHTYIHYITLHYTTLHYTTLHYTRHYHTYIHTLHYITLHYISITLYYITFHYIHTIHTIHYIALHCIA